MEIVDLPIKLKMVIFHGDVKLPEGMGEFPRGLGREFTELT